MRSKEYRLKESFLRNMYSGNNKYQIPLIKDQHLDLSNLNLISVANIKSNDNEQNRLKGVHFFVDDWRFIKFYENPYFYKELLSQYRLLFSPDFSIYGDMPIWKQIENTARNRWCGAYWQSLGYNVVPTISWGLSTSYDFCFEGVEKGSAVAVGMIGSKQSRFNFMSGYNEMLKRLNPSVIICFGNPYPEMKGNLLQIDYLSDRKETK